MESLIHVLIIFMWKGTQLPWVIEHYIQRLMNQVVFCCGYITDGFCHIMMTSSNGNIFRVTGPLCGEFTGDRWIPRTKTSDADLWIDLCLNKRLSKQSWDWWFDTRSHPLWRHCNFPQDYFTYIEIIISKVYSIVYSIGMELSQVRICIRSLPG